MFFSYSCFGLCMHGLHLHRARHIWGMLPIYSQLWFASFPCFFFFHLVLITMDVYQCVFLGWGQWAVLDTKLVGKGMLVMVKVLLFHAMLCQSTYGKLACGLYMCVTCMVLLSNPLPFSPSPWNVFPWVIADVSVCFNTCFYFGTLAWGDQKYKVASLY